MFKFLVFVIFAMEVEGNFNTIMDEALQLANLEIAMHGLSKMELPDIKYGVNDKIGFVNIDLGLEFKRGWVKDLATIKRKGDVNFPLGNDSTILMTAVMGLEQLDVHFDDLVTDLVFFKLHHNVSVAVKNNAVDFELAVTATGLNCSTQVTRFDISQFSDVTVTFYPDSLIDRVKDSVASLVVNIAAPVLKHVINPRLKPIFNEVLAKINVCQFVPKPDF